MSEPIFNTTQKAIQNFIESQPNPDEEEAFASNVEFLQRVGIEQQLNRIGDELDLFDDAFAQLIAKISPILDKSLAEELPTYKVEAKGSDVYRFAVTLELRVKELKDVMIDVLGQIDL
jgi:hypothetical protein